MNTMVNRRGVYPRLCLSGGCIGKTSPRNVPAHCTKLPKVSTPTRWQDTRGPCMPSTHTVFVSFSGKVAVGLAGPRRKEESKMIPPPYGYNLAGYTLQNLLNRPILPPVDHISPPFDRKPYPLLTDFDALRSECSEAGYTSPSSLYSPLRASELVKRGYGVQSKEGEMWSIGGSIDRFSRFWRVYPPTF